MGLCSAVDHGNALVTCCIGAYYRKLGAMHNVQLLHIAIVDILKPSIVLCIADLQCILSQDRSVYMSSALSVGPPSEWGRPPSESCLVVGE